MVDWIQNMPSPSFTLLRLTSFKLLTRIMFHEVLKVVHLNKLSLYQPRMN